jgi:hypothetical protein
VSLVHAHGYSVPMRSMTSLSELNPSEAVASMFAGTFASLM